MKIDTAMIIVGALGYAACTILEEHLRRKTVKIELSSLDKDYIQRSQQYFKEDMETAKRLNKYLDSKIQEEGS